MAEGPEHDIGSKGWRPDYIATHQAGQARYLDSIATSELFLAVAERAMGLLALQPGQRVLEVGCGTGVFLPRLAQAVGTGGEVVAIDHAATFVEEARTRIAALGLGATVRVERADALALPFDDARFDAAHVERVLMHLEDPDAALREMVRVVRPGGRVVAAEPDWGGLRIDHPERADFDAVYARSMPMRHPDMGLTLYRRLAAAGLVRCRAEPVWRVMHGLDEMRGYGLDLGIGAAALVAEGRLERGRADQVLATLAAIDGAGRYLAVGAFHVVSGEVPG